MADVKIPDRVGEGLSNISMDADGKTNLGLILNQLAKILGEVTDASQLTDFAAFKAAMASLSTLTESDDSKTV